MSEDLDPTSIASHLRLTSARLTRRMRQQVYTGLEDTTPAQYAALNAIVSSGQMTMSELAASLGSRPSGAGRTVDALAAKDLVGRERSETDGRVVIVRATPAGENLVQRIRTRTDTYIATRIAELDPQTRRLVVKALHVLDTLVRP